LKLRAVEGVGLSINDRAERGYRLKSDILRLTAEDEIKLVGSAILLRNFSLFLHARVMRPYCILYDCQTVGIRVAASCQTRKSAGRI